MKLEIFNDKAATIWKRVSGQPINDLLNVELALYKKLLVFFQIGESCYYVFNFLRLQFDYVSNEAIAVLGYEPEDVTTAVIMESVHPDDRDWFLACQDSTGRFLQTLEPEKMMKYKLRFDCRFRKKNGDYVRLMQQVVVLETDENGGVIRTLVVHTDISHLKQNGRPVLSYIGMDGEPSYLDVNVYDALPTKSEKLTKREKEILFLLTEGKASKEIGSILNISKQTVDVHRKNMLRKNNVSSSGELIGKAIKEGWI